MKNKTFLHYVLISIILLNPVPIISQNKSVTDKLKSLWTNKAFKAVIGITAIALTGTMLVFGIRSYQTNQKMGKIVDATIGDEQYNFSRRFSREPKAWRAYRVNALIDVIEKHNLPEVKMMLDTLTGKRKRVWADSYHTIRQEGYDNFNPTEINYFDFWSKSPTEVANDVGLERIQPNDPGSDVTITTFGTTALIRAIDLQKDDIVQYLLQKGFNPNFADFLGISPLEHAQATGNKVIIDLIKHYQQIYREPTLKTDITKGRT